ncbi:DinB superfamily protein [Pedobacter yonginense]|uniref:DinB superfamily protein n=1 Tax=Pedobacter yonginense TaxID=651869 RepID=A0A317EPS2_9SPHI|nr:DUF1572 family protein [Pedobacter yonginense]PWS27098.1 DinB superfamily protein [Pedobacter yonginense]
MIIQALTDLFTRDLGRLRTEIELYNHEENLWKVEATIANSAGNLCLHIIGNLNTYIGNEIGNTGYVRDRPLEFSLKGIPRVELLQKIDETVVVVSQCLGQLSEADLEREYPIVVLNEATSYLYFLIHLTTHLAYHLGQINYHRRLLDS